jgi:hypothetical protein
LIRYFVRLDSLWRRFLKALVIVSKEPEENDASYAPCRRRRLQKSLGGLIGIAVLLTFFPKITWAQKEVTANIYRYRDRELKSRYYEKHEFKPRTHLPFVEGKLPRAELITLAPTAEKVRFRKYLADSHQGLRFYRYRTCIRCHPQQARNLHKVRAKITCRQCHGGEPIAGINHYYSSMHPRRRYAFVCAKCHDGSSASFATYRIHEPSPITMGTHKTFPVLFYVFWGMIAIAAGTFAVFLPHAFMWGLREFLPNTFRWDLRRLLIRGRKKDDTD